MNGADVYRWLMHGLARPVCEQFDGHVVASVLSIAFEEGREGRSPCDALGLTPGEISELTAEFFPHAAMLHAGLDPASAPRFAEDEVCLQQLLARGSSERSRFEQLLARIIARRAQSPHHLWQDLGLRNRRELSWLMSRHFEPLAQRNHRDMKWKKYLYRTICRDAAFSLCTAPTCSECSDFADCFGDETGESRLANAGRDAALANTEPR